MFVPHVGQEEIKHPSLRAVDSNMINRVQECVCDNLGPGLPIPSGAGLRDRQQDPNPIGPAWAHSNEGAGPQCTLGPNSSPLDTNPRWERRRARLYPLSVEDLIIQNGPGPVTGLYGTPLHTRIRYSAAESPADGCSRAGPR
ncbi:unnamed protein product [Leuciscus chuanchicus]